MTQMIKIQQEFEWYYNNGFVTARDGNICMRLNDDEFLVTASGVRKDEIMLDDYVIVNRWGTVLRSGIKDAIPSIETGAHLAAIEHGGGDVSVHVHSPNTVALFHLFSREDKRTGMTTKSLELELNTHWPELFRYTNVGKTVEYFDPGSLVLHEEISKSFRLSHIQSMRGFHPTPDIVVMQRHGVFAVGDSLTECREHIQRLEHICVMLLKIISASGGKKESIL